MPDSRLTVAYIVNQYPQPSHTFIRREIAALEDQSVIVHRFSLRATRSTLVDPADQAEKNKTRAILDQGAFRVALAVLREMVTRPAKFLTAAKLTWRFSRASTRGKIAHLAYFAEACVLRPWLADVGATHLHAHFGTNSTAVAAICHELGGPPFSFTVHGPEEFDNPVGLSLGEKAQRAAFAITISAFGRSQLCRWCAPEVWPRIQVVRCGVDKSFLRPEDPEQSSTKAASPAGDVARFVCVGRLEPQKGQLLLVDAVARLMFSGSAPKIRVTFIGEGSLRPQIERRIQQLGLTDMIHLAGLKSGAEIRAEILASRAMVLPSFAEGLPVVLMESLALAKPVITTWIAGIPELVTASSGWLIPAGDIDALAEALHQVAATEQSKLEQMGQDGRARVIERHDSAIEATKLRHLFAGPSA